MINKLNFANVSEAYNIASEQIKNRQDQIDKLKKIINENSNVNNQNKDPNAQDKIPGILPQVPVQHVQPVQMNNTQYSEDFEYSFYKLAGNPRFDQAVQNYLILKHPDWLKNMNTPQIIPTNQMSKSSFGNFDSTDIKHYIIFFVFSIIIYLLLGILIKN
jgi:hypothetical protein